MKPSALIYFKTFFRRISKQDKYLSRLIFIHLPAKLIKFYLENIVSYFFKGFHRTAQAIFFQKIDKDLKLYSVSNKNLYYDCRTSVGEKRGHKYYKKSNDPNA